jgi:putative transcriptional regulator
VQPAFLQPVQNAPQSRLAKGKFLVAAVELGDPNFAETVVLLTDYNHDKGAMGIILNRATRVKLTELLPRLQSLTERADIIFEGGPVERAEILLLVRAPHEPEDSQPVFGDVYLSNSADLLERLTKERAKEETPFRVYSGYAGWAPGQLEAEVELGAWHIFPATSAAVFDTQPEDLWPQLIRRTTLRLANTLNPGATT